MRIQFKRPLFQSIFGLVLVGTLSTGCGNDTAFRARAQSQSTPVCTPTTVTKKLRIFVMVDNSGSTATTDPSQIYRVDTLRKFIGDYGNRPNLSYGFGYFADDAYIYDVNSGDFTMNAATTPIGTVAQITNALNVYHGSIPPVGGTGYAAAFAALEGAIARDEASGVTDDYAVVFMSDGQPTDLSGNVLTWIRTHTAGLKSAAAANGKSHLILSTVYFGAASDSTSINNLRTMATEGGGQFVNTNSSGGLAIEDVVTLPGC